MKLQRILVRSAIAYMFAFVNLILTGLPSALASNGAVQPKIKIVLAGDSTVTDESGWGKGFAELLNDQAECVNLAKSGRSSRSYRAEGWWSKCLEARPDYLLIQFGHNDQPSKGPERESDAKTEFRDHLRDYVKEAREAGIKPILITSLTRRRWNSEGKIEPTLAEYAEATRMVANELSVPLIDLHKSSIQQCEQIGPTAFRAFEPMNEKGVDHTHLNLEGSRAVSPLVVRGLVEAVGQLSGIIDQKKLAERDTLSSRKSELTSGSLTLVETPNSIVIRLAEKPLLTYNKVSPPVPDGMNPAFHRSGFLHPVVSPNGATVTATFPHDHAHQHGIFSAWVSTKWNDREIDFWNLAKSTGRVLHQRVVKTFTEAGRIGFEVDLIHRAEQQPVVDILRERWKISVSETDGSFYMFDLEATQSALTDIPLIVEKYHYGGMGYRGPVRWLSDKGESAKETTGEREPFEFINDQGSDRLTGNEERSRWVVASGQIDSRPVSIAVLCHKDSFRAPQAARLHPTKPYFAYSPCIDGEFSIDRQHDYRASYRYLITDTPPDADWINQQWDRWNSQ
jgi:lysophospholipase L1-like esterase